ncbi:MAG: MFS transporter [Promethearchaeota archaeon]
MTENEFVDKKKYWKEYYPLLEGLFYFFQGIFYTGFQVGMGIKMVNIWGFDPAKTAATMALISMPTFLKMFTGLLSDRVPIGKFGRRKPYLVLGGILYLPSFIGIAMMDSYNTSALLLLLLTMVAFVFVDGTLDAFTVDITPLEHSSRMQGAASAGRMLGMAIGALLAGFLSLVIPLNTTLIIIGALAAMQTVVAMFFKEPEVTKELLKNQKPLGKVMKETFGSSRTWLGIVFSICLLGTVGGINSLVSNFLLDEIGLSEFEFAMAILANAIGGFIGSIVLGKLGRKYKDSMKFVWLTLLAIWLFIVPLLFINSDSNVWVVYIVEAFYGVSRGLVTVLTYLFIMQLCPESVEGFVFATMTSFMNIGLMAITPNVIAFFIPILGFAPSFFTLIPFSVLAVALIPKIKKQKEKDDVTVSAA